VASPWPPAVTDSPARRLRRCHSFAAAPARFRSMKSLIRHLPIASCVDPYGLGLIFTIAWAVLIFGMLELRQVVRDIGRRWAAYF